jgi:hypothetical protein
MRCSPASTPRRWPPAPSTLSWTDEPNRPLHHDADIVDRNNPTGGPAMPRHLIRSVIAFRQVDAGVALLLPGSLALRGAALVLAVLLALVDSSGFIAMNARRRPRSALPSQDPENARATRRHKHETARGGVKTPEEDIPAVKDHIAKYYKKMGETPPRERD